MGSIGALKVVLAVSCCGTIFFGLWALHQFRTQRQSALAIGCVDCAIFAILATLLISLFGVRQIPSKGLGVVFINVFHIMSLVTLILIVGSMIAVGCSSNSKVRKISKWIFLISACIWILTFMAEMLTIY